MNTIFRSSVFALIILFAISLSACSDLLVQEAFMRSMGQIYRAQQTQAVTPGGQFETGFAAGIFEQLAEIKRQEILRREVQRSREDQYARRLEEQVRRKGFEAQIIKVRAEIEAVLLQDKTALRQWVDSFNEWADYCKQNVRNYAPDSYCGFAETLLAECQAFHSRVGFYLANLPAYIHVNMDVREAQLEIDDYRFKRDRLVKKLKAWKDAVSKLEQEEEERLKRIEVDRRKF